MQIHVVSDYFILKSLKNSERTESNQLFIQFCLLFEIFIACWNILLNF